MSLHPVEYSYRGIIIKTYEKSVSALNLLADNFYYATGIISDKKNGE